MRLESDRRFHVSLLALTAAAIGAMLISLCWGTYRVSLPDVLRTLLGQGSKAQNTAILTSRLPRILVGAFVATALSLSGAILQTMTRNDLADPGIIGINAGGAVAAVLFINGVSTAYYSELGMFSIFVLPLMAIIGALTAAALIFAISGWKKLRPRRLLLIGIGVNAGLNAFIIFFTYRGSVGEYNRVLTWTTGSLWGSGWPYALVLMPIVMVLTAFVFWNHKLLDAMSFTDEIAIGWGLNVEHERRKLMLAAVILGGAATAFAGNIGFLGLIAPHIARRIVGPQHRRFLPVSIMIAIIIVVTADAASRNLFSPIEIPAGIAISIVGVPYFVYLMLKR